MTPLTNITNEVTFIQDLLVVLSYINKKVLYKYVLLLLLFL